MLDRDALLAAILAKPDEDTPRLIFADWLQENGDPLRAEFIRVQIELARLREAERDLPYSFEDEFYTYTDEPNRVQYTYCRHQSPERIELLRRQAELLALSNNRVSWQTELPKYAVDHATSGVGPFRRGFVGRVRSSLVPLLKDPAALWKCHPIDALSLTNCAGQTTTAKVPRCTYFERVRELSFPNSNGPPPLLAPFARCPHLANLRSLDLLPGGLMDADATILAGSEHLRPTRFRFNCSNLSREAFAALLQSPFASKLRDLDLESAPDWALEVIAEAPLDGLRMLRLQRAGCGDAAVAALTRSPHLRGLVTLHLSGNNLTDESAEALAAWPGLANIRSLDLSDADITGAGVQALVRSPHFNPIHLDLRWTSAGDIGAVALARWPGLANVSVLAMQDAQVCDTGGLALARSTHWRDIRYLLLSGGTLRRAYGALSERFGNVLSTSG